MLTPHAAVLAALALRLLAASDALRCAWEVGLLAAANFVGWLRLVDYMMLERRVGPFFIMVPIRACRPP